MQSFTCLTLFFTEISFSQTSQWNVLWDHQWLLYCFIPVKLLPQSWQKKDVKSWVWRWLCRCFAVSHWKLHSWHKWVLLLISFIILFNHETSERICLNLFVNHWYLFCFCLYFISWWCTKTVLSCASLGTRTYDSILYSIMWHIRTPWCDCVNQPFANERHC